MAEDLRTRPIRRGDERETLCAFLDFQRQTLLMKVAGLSDNEARQQLLLTPTSLMGLVRHLSEVERWWFRITFAGEPIRLRYCDDENPERDWYVEPGDTLADAVTAYEEECEAARAVVAAAPSLDELAQAAIRHDEPNYSLRWILVHMIEETARHNGHADILRELTDGEIGA
ncbi:MAG: DinB family protein [Egibacteraceae bacterium]